MGLFLYFFIREEHFELYMLTVRNFSEEMKLLFASLKWKQATSSILLFAKAMGWFYFDLNVFIRVAASNNTGYYASLFIHLVCNWGIKAGRNGARLPSREISHLDGSVCLCHSHRFEECCLMRTGTDGLGSGRGLTDALLSSAVERRRLVSASRHEFGDFGLIFTPWDAFLFASLQKRTERRVKTQIWNQLELMSRHFFSIAKEEVLVLLYTIISVDAGTHSGT